MLKLKIKAMIFDMDGVITDTMPYHFRAWRKVYADEGFHITKNEIYRREGQPGYVTIKEIAQKYHLSFKGSRPKEILDKKEALFNKIAHRRFIRGSRRFLHLSKKRGFVLALVTGTARHEVRRILPRELLGLFSVIVTGDQVKKGKPHPEPYLLALKKLRTKPEDVVVFENAPFGIISAKKAHLRCLALETYLPKTALKRADAVFSSFRELCRKVNFSVLVND